MLADQNHQTYPATAVDISTLTPNTIVTITAIQYTADLNFVSYLTVYGRDANNIAQIAVLTVSNPTGDVCTFTQAPTLSVSTSLYSFFYTLFIQQE